VLEPLLCPQLHPATLAALSGSSGAASYASGNLSSLIIFSTDLDGGSACVGMSNVSQAFTVSNQTNAEFDVAPLALDAVLSQSNAAAHSGLDTVTFANSLYPQCFSRATKKSHIAQPADSSSSSSNSSARSTRQVALV